MTILNKEMAANESEEKVSYKGTKSFSGKIGMLINASEDIISKVIITFELDGGKITFPLIVFFPFEHEEKKRDLFIKTTTTFQKSVIIILVIALIFILIATKILLVSKKLDLPKKNAQ